MTDDERLLIPVGALLGIVSEDAIDLARWRLMDASIRVTTVTRREGGAARESLERLRRLIGKTSGQSDLAPIVADAIAWLDLAEETTKQFA